VRVLIVDDLAAEREVMREAVAAGGHDVVAVGFDTDAESLWAEQFDLLITDLDSDGRSGIELMREARRRQPGLSTA
jgi:CheY-like chemotaxis protein